MGRSIKISLEPNEHSSKEILLALLSDAGFEAFEEEKDILHAYIKEELFSENELNTIINEHVKHYHKTLIEETNWNQVWEESFEPVVVRDFCTVRASFHEHVTHSRHEIIITPRMSFGTGHHATTWLMIDEMSTIDFSDKSVLDFGTGTGILAILAEKLGATTIHALDNDRWSIENAIENFAENFSKNIMLEKADKLALSRKFDIVLANINKHVILAQLANMEQHLADEGVLLLSGLLAPDEPEIKKQAMNYGLSIVEQKNKDGWILLRLSRG